MIELMVLPSHMTGYEPDGRPLVAPPETVNYRTQPYSLNPADQHIAGLAAERIAANAVAETSGVATWAAGLQMTGLVPRPQFTQENGEQ